MLSGNLDMCNALDHKSAEQKKKLEIFGFPTECPIPEGMCYLSYMIYLHENELVIDFFPLLLKVANV